MATIERTAANFKDVIDNNTIAIVDFWAEWCGPCRSFAPTFEAVSEKHPDVAFAKVNTEEECELAAGFNIRSIPTLMVLPRTGDSLRRSRHPARRRLRAAHRTGESPRHGPGTRQDRRRAAAVVGRGKLAA